VTTTRSSWSMFGHRAVAWLRPAGRNRGPCRGPPPTRAPRSAVPRPGLLVSGPVPAALWRQQPPRGRCPLRNVNAEGIPEHSQARLTPNMNAYSLIGICDSGCAELTVLNGRLLHASTDQAHLASLRARSVSGAPLVCPRPLSA